MNNNCVTTRYEAERFGVERDCSDCECGVGALSKDLGTAQTLAPWRGILAV